MEMLKKFEEETEIEAAMEWMHYRKKEEEDHIKRAEAAKTAAEATMKRLEERESHGKSGKRK